MAQGRTTIQVDPEVRDELADLKPYDSMSFNDLLRDMAGHYNPPMEGQ
jgi:hypothetical protein